MVTTNFAKFVAEEQKSEAIVMKQNHLWHEELDAESKKRKGKDKSGGRGGGGGGGGAGGDSAAAAALRRAPRARARWPARGLRRRQPNRNQPVRTVFLLEEAARTPPTNSPTYCKNAFPLPALLRRPASRSGTSRPLVCRMRRREAVDELAADAANALNALHAAQAGRPPPMCWDGANFDSEHPGPTADVSGGSAEEVCAQLLAAPSCSLQLLPAMEP